jgi:arginine decarboxylase-like protein
MGLTQGQFVCSEDLVCASDGELKMYTDRRMVASGFEQ